MLLLLLLYYSPCSDDTSLRASFARFFKIGVGLMGVSFVVLLHIGVGLSSMGTKIVIKDGDKDADRYCLGEALKKHGRANVKDPNWDCYSAKQLAATRPECYTEKKSTKEPKIFDEESSMAEPSNTENKIPNVSRAVFYSTSDKFWICSESTFNQSNNGIEDDIYGHEGGIKRSEIRLPISVGVLKIREVLERRGETNWEGLNRICCGTKKLAATESDSHTKNFFDRKVGKR